jgi:hypothetical protein
MGHRTAIERDADAQRLKQRYFQSDARLGAQTSRTLKTAAEDDGSINGQRRD